MEARCTSWPGPPEKPPVGSENDVRDLRGARAEVLVKVQLVCEN